MSEVRGLRVGPSAALKERRLALLLAEGRAAEPLLREAVEDAQVLGSLELAGFSFTWEQVKAARRGEPAQPALRGLREALRAVGPEARFGARALLAWHRAVLGIEVGFRAGERSREGAPPPAPPAFIPGRLAILEEWLGSPSDLGPLQQGALALARIVEILPFEDGNGRVSRLAASHIMVCGGLRPPILVGADRPRLEAGLRAAFRLETEPLAALLEEASVRALDVMIQTLEASG